MGNPALSASRRLAALNGSGKRNQSKIVKLLKVLAMCASVAMVILGVVGGIYVSVWLMLVGGIVQVIEAAKLTPVDSMAIAIGIVKVLFCSFAGWGTFVVCSLFARVAAAFAE